jgi:xanthine dehydrogenase accessory factor
MQSLDLSVIKQLCSWLESKQNVWLCTVINTWGSAPRLPGSLLACNGDGVVVGSLSGGCIEDDLIEQLRDGRLAADKPEYKIYGETQAEVERFKLPCGGTLGILIEPICADQQTHFRTIESSLQNRQTICREQHWQDKHTTIIQNGEAPGIHFEKNEQGQPLRIRQIYGPATHLFIIGVSEVSQALAQFALATGFRVTICDPRPSMIKQWSIENTTTVTAMPDDALRQHATDRASAIVAVTHDPRIDDMGLMDAFETDAFYIGAMGSKKSSDNRRQRLQALGVSETQLKRLHAPIGLDIHSKTPAEIAIAIVAELIKVRNETNQNQ